MQQQQHQQQIGAAAFLLTGNGGTDVGDGAMREFATLAIGRTTFEGLRVEEEDGPRFLTKEEAEERYRAGHFGETTRAFAIWWMAQPTKVRTWFAEWLTAGGVDPVDLDIDIGGGDWGFPVVEAMQLLESYAEEGWRLINVSEDHGLYTGADAAQEAYLTRVRYLLAR